MKLNLDSTDEAQIQIIPLIDVIFCILTFFILAALQLTRQQGINVDLPKANTGTVQTQASLMVYIDPAGQIYVDKQLIDRAQLFQIVQNYHQQQPDGLLILSASQTALYNDVIQVLDILRTVGGDRAALSTAPPSNQPSPTPGLAPTPTPFVTPGLNAPPGGTDLFGNPIAPTPGGLQTTPAPVPTGQSPLSPAQETVPTTAPSPPQQEPQQEPQ
ncbi:MAG: biopolymer transporter ExbD [Leptolyngbyaceae cyanobacterium SU_3_3]|nr:biopolymer transporter ExbD [Leptolyngbyaceae cyanobacterium SU_3_3]